MPSPDRPDKYPSKLAILCPHFPPQPGGVSDYVARIAGQFALEGREVRVWTATKNPASLPGVEVTAREMASPWGWSLSELRAIEREVRAWGAHALILQYTPYLYSPGRYGFHPSLNLWVPGLQRRMGCPLVLMAHELHYPLKPDARGLLVGLPQLAQFLGIAHFADLVWFSYEVPLRRFRKAIPWAARRFDWFPVGSTITRYPLTFIKSNPVTFDKGKRILLQFGSDHPARPFGHSFQALKALRERGEDAELVYAGVEAAVVQRKLEEAGFSDLAPWVQGLGYLSPEASSAWLSRADLVLAPFVDGISTRRSSAMAALAHARPLLTTRGYHTDPSVEWESFARLVPSADAPAFARAACELLQDRARAEALGQAARKRYEELFSWEVIARGMLARLEQLPLR